MPGGNSLIRKTSLAYLPQMQRMLRSLLFAGVFLSVPFLGFAQRHQVDSLLAALKPPKDTLYAKTLLELGYSYRLVRLDSMSFYAQEGLRLSEALSYPKGIAQAKHVTAIHHNIQGDHDSARALWGEALAMATELGEVELQAKILNGLGSVAFQQADYAQSADYYWQALRMNEKMANEVGMFTNLNNLTNLYMEMSAYTEAVEISQKALESARRLGDKRREGLILSNRGNLFGHLGKIEEAENSYRQSITMLKEAGAKNQEASSWLGLGGVLSNQKFYGAADSCLAEAYRLFSEVGETPGIVQSRITGGTVALFMQDYPRAETYLLEALAAAESMGYARLRSGVLRPLVELELQRNHLSAAERYITRHQVLVDSMGSPTFMYQGLGLLASLRARQGRYQEAYTALNRSIEIKDSVAGSEQQQVARDLEAAFRLSRQDTELRRIEETAEEKRRADRLSNQILYGLLFVGLFFLGAAGYFYQYRRYRQQREMELASRAEELDRRVAEQTSEIMAQAEELMQANHELEATLAHLKETQQQLVHSEKMASLGQLTAGIAHEINNPVNFITANITPLKADLKALAELLDYSAQLVNQYGGAEAEEKLRQQRHTLQAEDAEQEVELLIQGIATGADRTAEIVRGLRNFSRIDESEYKLANLQDSLESTLLLLSSEFRDRIEVHRSYSEIPDFLCYPGQLNQLFMNLLVNAGQAIPDKGEIFIRTMRVKTLTGEEAVIEVQDTGVGMPEEVQRRIFEPFYTTKEVGKGTGLGLSISHAIVEKHRGSIAVKSSPGQGTTFTVHLPIVYQS